MRRNTRILVTFGVGLIFAGALYLLIDRLNYWYRQRWHFVASMQDLPPADRSHWPKPPVPWTNETVEVEAATPEGLKRLRVAYFVNSIGMKLVRIEPGTFRMGLPDSLAREAEPGLPPTRDQFNAQQMRVTGSYGYAKPDIKHHEGKFTEHEVRLTRSYYLAVFETTDKQYELFDPSHVHHRASYQRGAEYDNHPVQPISWRKAQEFCRWLSEKERRLYRLPTEAEWEYACRAGTTTRIYWGDNILDRTKANLGGPGSPEQRGRHFEWSDDGYEFTAPVGSYPPNPWGLYDMIGNSREWVVDWFSWFTDEPAVDPRGPPTGHCRVDMGGGWNTTLTRPCCAFRDGESPHDVKDIRGFRVACEVE
jgi:formylglycine-generating enzyme required for sulfatase activity